MPIKKGHTNNPHGRPKGSENHITKQMKTVKETVLNVFHEIQSDPKVNLANFAKEYPRDFYNIAAKLIPTELSASIHDSVIRVVYEDENPK